MADIPLTLTTAGLTALAAAQLSDVDFLIDSIKLGTGQYTPDGTETDIMTPFGPVKEFADPAGSSSGSTFAFVFSDPSADVYNAGELGVFCW